MGVGRSVARKNAVRFDLRSDLRATATGVGEEKKESRSLDRILAGYANLNCR